MNDSFDDLAKDYFLQGLVTAENLKKFIKEGDEKKIEHSLVSFDDKLKIDEDYGSGKFVYFMIKFMYICLENLLTNNSEKKYTLIIDEPEAFLHPGLIREVAFLLRKINKKINVIVATHSVDFLQYFCTNETNIHFLTVEFEKTTPKTLEKKNFKKKHFKELEEINIFNKKKIFLSLMSSKIIFVEGENDLKLIEYILYTDEELKFSKDIFIWSCKGKWNITAAIEFAESTGRFSPEDAFFILYDKDKSLGDKKNKILRKTAILAEWNNLKIESDKDFKNNLIENKKPKHIHEFEKKIEKLQSYFFEFNLEKYFKWEGEKYKFNPYDFFLGQENKKKLNKFMEDSGLENFFKKKL